MYSVLFEVHPESEKWETYLQYATMLKPELQQINGFIDNIRYRSLTREGWVLSLSGWENDKSLIRWRIQANHHGIQEKGHTDVLLDHHLRVGQITQDTQPPQGHELHEQRLDETGTGDGTTVVLVDSERRPESVEQTSPREIARSLRLAPHFNHTSGLVTWDVFDAVLTPGQVILLTSWRDQATAESFEKTISPDNDARLRRVRVVRDYTMFDRREAPQYYPKAAPAGKSRP